MKGVFMSWVDKAYEEIENDYEAGNISSLEYKHALMELRQEIEEEQYSAFDYEDN